MMVSISLSLIHQRGVYCRFSNCNLGEDFGKRVYIIERRE